MSTNRRDFLRLSALASGTVGLGLVPGASALAEALNNFAGSVGKAAKHRLYRALPGEVCAQPRPQGYCLQSR
jgi:hypothetical protein